MESPEYNDADREAIACTNDGSASWKEAHDQWARRTRRDLSPNSFGKRIVDRGGGRLVRPMNTPPTMSKQSSQQQHGSASPRPGQPAYAPLGPSPSVGGRTLPPIQSARPLLLSRSPSNSNDAQRTDVQRLESAMSRMDQRFADLENLVQRLRYDLDVKLASKSSSTEEGSAVEMLSNTVSSLTHKTGELDALKVQLELLKGRIGKLERSPPNDASHMTPPQYNPPLPHHTHHQVGPPPHSQPLPPAAAPPLQIHPAPAPAPHGHDAQQSANGHWNLVNGLKRKPANDSPASYDYTPQKRSKSSTRTDNIIMYDALTNPMASKNNKTGAAYRHPVQPSQSANSESPASNHLPSLNAVFPDHLRDTSYANRKPGRPRKYTSPEPETPDSERAVSRHGTFEGTGALRSSNDQSGYFNTFGSAIGGPGSERGRLIRRGSGGNTFMGIVEKKTRQRPVRNADGVLIRKDGKPDQRSISSPMNLKKVHAKKMNDVDSSRASLSSTTSPTTTTHRDHSREGSEERDHDDSRISASPKQSRAENLSPTDHSEVMGRMFPKSVGDDARRMDHASRLFGTETKADSKQSGDERSSGLPTPPPQASDMRPTSSVSAAGTTAQREGSDARDDQPESQKQDERVADDQQGKDDGDAAQLPTPTSMESKRFNHPVTRRVGDDEEGESTEKENERDELQQRSSTAAPASTATGRDTIIVQSAPRAAAPIGIAH